MGAARARHEALDRHVDRDTEVERQVGPHREAVKLAHPLPVDAACRVAGKGGVGVAVGQHDHARLQRRDDLIQQAIGEVRGVEQAERHRGERVLFLARLGGGLHQGGRVPFGDEHAMPLGAEPLRQQIQLRRFPGAVDPLDHEQLPRVFVRLGEIVQHRRFR